MSGFAFGFRLIGQETSIFQEAKTMRVLAAAVVVLGVLGGVAAAAEDGLVPTGQVELAEVGGEQEWGTATETVVTYMAHDFQLFQGTEGPYDAATAGRVCASGRCGWLAGLQVPNGAQIRSIELSACDGSTTGSVVFALLRGPRIPGQIAQVGLFAGSGAAQTPGCTFFLNPLASPPTVANGTDGYFLDVLADPGTNILWTYVRVRYRLQVSPAPATASFPLDVPTTSPYFRFVEAMAASGLTGGCAAGRFCPDTPVTRGQLAVFLASALGLHFPN